MPCGVRHDALLYAEGVVPLPVCALKKRTKCCGYSKSQPLAHHCDAEGVVVQQLLGMGEQTVGCKIMKKRAKAAIPEIRKE